MSGAGFDEITGDWDYRRLPANVRIGAGAWLERRDSFARFRSERDPGLVIGERVRVHTWTTFNVDPEGLIEIGADSILVGAVFMCARHIRIGRGVIVSYNVTLADSDFHPLDLEQRRADAVANAPGGDRARRPPVEARPITVEDGAWIGIGAMVLKGVRIGRGARVGPGAVVTRDVAPGQCVAGNPAVAVGSPDG